MTRTKNATPDKRTMPLPGIPKRTGRPYTGKAKSNAERQAAYRKRQAKIREYVLDDVQKAFSSTSTEEVRKMIAEGGKRTMELAWQELGRRMGWLK